MGALPPVRRLRTWPHAPRNSIVFMMAAALGRNLVTLVKVSVAGEVVSSNNGLSQKVTVTEEIFNRCHVRLAHSRLY